MRFRTVTIAALVGLFGGLAPVPALALSPPETLAAQRSFGRVDGTAAPVEVAFPIDHLGVSWIGDEHPSVRFRIDRRWTPWIEVTEDDLPSSDGWTFSSLLPASDAEAYQIRGTDSEVRAVAINTTDGPRSWVLQDPPSAHALTQPDVVTRSEWGADESLRFRGKNKEIWPTEFYDTQKLVVHHTATLNADPDPAATVRAIYRYHAVDRGWGDIGYNFLIGPQGEIYKGRYSGPPGTRDRDTATGEDAQSRGVTAAHTGGYNSGTMGIAVLGDYRTAPIPSRARSALIDHLAWEAERHDLDPMGSSGYVNPANGSRRTTPNISGHLDWVATECPGEAFYSDLPRIREEVADRMASSPDDPEPSPPPITLQADGYKEKGRHRVELMWDGAGSERVDIWRDGARTATTPNDGTYLDRIEAKGSATYTYVVCAAGTDTCSNSVSVSP